LPIAFNIIESVYCSSACQSSAWKAHKTTCGSDRQVEQTLPSQDVVEEHLKEMWGEVDLTPPPDVVPFLEALRSSRDKPKGKDTITPNGRILASLLRQTIYSSVI